MTLDRWLDTYAAPARVPLFAHADLVAATLSWSGRTVLKRHAAFDARMIALVEAELARPTWLGLVYVMHWVRDGATLPLYIGKAERAGVTRPLSFNLKQIRTNQHAFGRWGYGLAYHIGDLSHAIFREAAYRRPSAKYERWAAALFDTFDPVHLREPVFVALIGWETGMTGPSGLEVSVPALEKELIALTGTTYSDVLLNCDGR